MDEKISISADALIDWKNQCEADKCSEHHKTELIKGAFLAWKKYIVGIKSKWTEKVQIKGNIHKLCFSSDIKDMFDEEKYNQSIQDGKTAPHPFHAIEVVLYNQKRSNGQPLKNWLLSNEKSQSPGWLITVLFQEVLFRKFIQKQEKISEYNQSIDDEKYGQVPDTSEKNLSKEDESYIREKIQEKLKRASEKQIAACYYKYKCARISTYELSVEEIFQITGVRKVFYDYSTQLLKDCVSSLIQEGFEISEISPVLSAEIYKMALENEICRSLDAKVGEKNRKK